MYNGIVNVYKESGFTSFDVVAKCRGIFGQRKVGHAGTLDPIAEGVLVVLLGSATKLSEFLAAEDKIYETEILLGTKTDTCDISGKVINSVELSEKSITDDDVRKAVSKYIGKQMQIPPLYSAIKKNGKKLYEYARDGEDVYVEPRPIEIYNIEILSIKIPVVKIRIHCSKGTYIRSLCRDIGEELKTDGCMKTLIRRETHGLCDTDALTLEELNSLKEKGKLHDAVLEVDELMKGVLTAEIKPEKERFLINGNKIRADDLIFIKNHITGFSDGEKVAVTFQGKVYALYQMNIDTEELKIVKMLRPE